MTAAIDRFPKADTRLSFPCIESGAGMISAQKPISTNVPTSIDPGAIKTADTPAWNNAADTDAVKPASKRACSVDCVDSI